MSVRKRYPARQKNTIQQGSMEDHPAVQAVKAKEEAGSEPAAWPMYVAPEVSGLHEKQQVFQYHAQQAQRALAAYEARAAWEAWPEERC